MDCSEMKKFFYRLVEKCLSFLTDDIVAVSKCEKNRAIGNKICKAEKIKVIFNGIDITAFDFGRTKRKISKVELGIPSDSYVIGIVGRICYNKAPDVFLKAASLIKQKIPEAFFVFVGDGPEIEKVKQLINQYFLQDCTLITGWTDDPFQYITKFNQGMLLTRWEGFGLVLAEYMIAKVPIIATNIDSIPELITDKVNGLLVNVNDAEGTALASIEIYENKNLCDKLVANGDVIVRSGFDIKRVAIEHGILFEKSKFIHRDFIF